LVYPASSYSDWSVPRTRGRKEEKGVDPEVELGEEFSPSGLSSVKGFGSGEVLQVLNGR